MVDFEPPGPLDDVADQAIHGQSFEILRMK